MAIGIVWTVTNAAFLPILYFLYPETGQFGASQVSFLKSADYSAANRSLEDIDAYYRENPSLIVIKDPDAICRRRPQKYIDHEVEEVEKTAISKGVAPVASEHVEWTGETR